MALTSQDTEPSTYLRCKLAKSESTNTATPSKHKYIIFLALGSPSSINTYPGTRLHSLHTNFNSRLLHHSWNDRRTSCHIWSTGKRLYLLHLSLWIHEENASNTSDLRFFWLRCMGLHVWQPLMKSISKSLGLWSDTCNSNGVPPAQHTHLQRQWFGFWETLFYE